MTTKVTVAIPTIDFNVDIRLAGSLVSASHMLMASGNEMALTGLGGCSVLPKARNKLVADFLETEADALMFIDADTVFPPENIFRAVKFSEGKDIVAGVCPLKRDDVRFRVSIKEPYVVDDGLLEVERAGTAFMLIRRHVLEEMIKHYPTAYDSDTDRDHHVLFDFQVTEEGYLGEDYTFCDRARKHGFRIWVDPLMQFDHIGPKSYSGRLADHLEIIE
jgi:hypothetical protein